MMTHNKPTHSDRPAGSDLASSQTHQPERPGCTDASAEEQLSSIEFNARVSRKAYELFEARGRREGRGLEDWLEAERLVKQELKEHP